MTERVIRERESGSPRSYTNLLNRINPPPPLLESPPFCPATRRHPDLRYSYRLREATSSSPPSRPRFNLIDMVIAKPSLLVDERIRRILRNRA